VVATAVAVLATSCTQVRATESVGSDRASAKAMLATSTTAPPRAKPSVAGASRSQGVTLTTQQAQLAATVQQLVAKLAQDPAAIAQLLGLDPSQLLNVTGLDMSVLDSLRISAEAVQALAAFLAGIDPATLGFLANGGASLDAALTASIVDLANQLDPIIAAVLRKIDPAALATLITTATQIDPKVLDALGSVLRTVDPTGLGALASDRSTLAIIVVLLGVALRTDSGQFAVLLQAAGLDPAVKAAIEAISQVVNTLTPAVIAQLQQLSSILSPEVVQALSVGLALINRPDVAQVLREAAANPVTLSTTLAIAVLLIPGLAEVIDPTTYADPQARYQILVGLLVAAVANLQGFDVEWLARQLGVIPR
jgi:hypothetical protein